MKNKTYEEYRIEIDQLCTILSVKDVNEVIPKALERINQSYYLGHEFLEEERHVALEELEQYDSINDYMDSPETYDHEALDRTFIVSNMVSEYLLDHPTILADPKLYRLAAIAQSALASLYGEVGKLHLKTEEPF